MSDIVQAEGPVMAKGHVAGHNMRCNKKDDKFRLGNESLRQYSMSAYLVLPTHGGPAVAHVLLIKSDTVCVRISLTSCEPLLWSSIRLEDRWLPYCPCTHWTESRSPCSHRCLAHSGRASDRPETSRWSAAGVSLGLHTWLGQGTTY